MRALLPHLSGVDIDSVDATAGGVRIRAAPLSTSASRPTCGLSSKRVHSRYERMLADTAIAGRPSYVVLQVRRFLCSNTGCVRRTFVEQIDGLTKAYARTTSLLREILEKIALALAGRAGSTTVREWLEKTHPGHNKSYDLQFSPTTEI